VCPPHLQSVTPSLPSPPSKCHTKCALPAFKVSHQVCPPHLLALTTQATVQSRRAHLHPRPHYCSRPHIEQAGHKHSLKSALCSAHKWTANPQLQSTLAHVQACVLMYVRRSEVAWGVLRNPWQARTRSGNIHLEMILFFSRRQSTKLSHVRQAMALVWLNQKRRALQRMPRVVSACACACITEGFACECMCTRT